MNESNPNSQKEEGEKLEKLAKSEAPIVYQGKQEGFNVTCFFNFETFYFCFDKLKMMKIIGTFSGDKGGKISCTPLKLLENELWSDFPEKIKQKKFDLSQNTILFDGMELSLLMK